MQKYIQRETMAIIQDAMRVIWDDGIDPFSEKDKIILKLENLNQVKTKSFEKLQTIVAETLVNLAKMQENESNITGLDTGYLQMNKVLSGWQNSDLIILGITISLFNCPASFT
jgi:replicative DNA helicase